MTITHTDSIIFDMDGTLWDATDSYAAVWNHCFAGYGSDLRITGAQLVPYMGKPIEVIVDGITAGHVNADFDKMAFVTSLEVAEHEMMPHLGGKLYPGVYEGLEALARHYKLFMVSNCGCDGLRNFMEFTGTTRFFTDSVTYGERAVPKSENMRYLVEKHHLAHAIYMGDTQGDCDETHRAGLLFAYAQYGFGECVNFDMAFDRFADFTHYFIELKHE